MERKDLYEKKYISSLALFIFTLFLILNFKTEANAYGIENHKHDYKSEIQSNVTHHWRDCKDFPNNCPGPNQTIYDTFESHIVPDSYPNNNCMLAKECSVCKASVQNGYPCHDIPISGGKCRHKNCNYECYHSNSKGATVCGSCSINLIDSSANVYVHQHLWGNLLNSSEIFYDSNKEYHWLNCYNPECPLTDISDKNSFGAHVYSDSETCANDVVCSVCNFALRPGYSSHKYSSVDGKCEHEGCTIECNHPKSCIKNGKCTYCGYTLPVTDSVESDTISTTNKDVNKESTKNDSEIKNDSNKTTSNIEKDEIKNEAKTESNITKESNVNDTNSNVSNSNSSFDKKEDGFIKRFFNSIGSFFKNLFSK